MKKVLKPLNITQLGQVLLNHSIMIICFCSALGFAEGKDPRKDFQLSFTALQKEELAGNVELWSPHWIDSGYFRFARFGLLAGTNNYYQSEDQKRRHVSSFETALGYQISVKAESAILRQSFLLGFAEVDRRAKAGPDGPSGDREPRRFSYFEARHGFEFIPPTHLAFAKTHTIETDDVKAPQRSLLEMGLGLRWNFIGQEHILSGDIPIREIQVFPYLSAHMFI